MRSQTRGSRPPRARMTNKSRLVDRRHLSACLDEDPELFFPIGNTGPAILQIEEAKQVCRRCDVREQCLAWALEAGQDHGGRGWPQRGRAARFEAPQRPRPGAHARLISWRERVADRAAPPRTSLRSSQG